MPFEASGIKEPTRLYRSLLTCQHKMKGAQLSGQIHFIDLTKDESKERHIRKG
jgi:hypothetical protein